jgi:hypothetical protein
VEELELAHPQNATQLMGVDLKGDLESESTKKRMTLLEKQISIVMRKKEQSHTDENCNRF